MWSGDRIVLELHTFMHQDSTLRQDLQGLEPGKDRFIRVP